MMPRQDGDSQHRLEKKLRSETKPGHTAKGLIASILDSLIMQSEDHFRHSSSRNIDEYMYISPHACIIRKAVAGPNRCKKLTAKIICSNNVCHERAWRQREADVYEDQNVNTNMYQDDRHNHQNDSHLETIYYDASSPDKSSEIIEAANTLSKWAIETSQKELRAILENQLKEISIGTKNRLEQEVAKTGKIRGILKKRSAYADRCEKRSEDVDAYEAESRRLVQLVINTVLKDMESEFREKELSELEKSVNGYESVIAAKALWLSEEVMRDAVSEIQKELTCLEEKISTRQQSSPVDETLLSREIGDIVNRSITNAIQDKESKKVNLVFSDFEEGGTGSASAEINKSSSCLAKQAICESVEDITEDFKNSSIQDAQAESHMFEYNMNNGGATTAPRLNAENVNTRLGTATNQTEVNSDGAKPTYSSTKYISLRRPDENFQEATTSAESDRVISRKYITLTGDHKKKYPPIIRPLESLQTIGSVDELQDNITTPTRDANLISRRSSLSRNSSNKMVNGFREAGRSREDIDTPTSYTRELHENVSPPPPRRNSSGISRNNNTYTDVNDRPLENNDTTNFVELADENVAPPRQRRNSSAMSRGNSTHANVRNGMMNEYQMSEIPVEHIETRGYTVETEESLPPPPPPIDVSNDLGNQAERTWGNTQTAWEGEEHLLPPPPHVRRTNVTSRNYDTGSNSRMMDGNHQMEMSTEGISATNYAVETFENLPPPPPREDDAFIDSDMVDEYPQVERKAVSAYHWESGGNVPSVASGQQSPNFRNRFVNGYGQIDGPAEGTDTTGYAGDTEESVGRFGESQDVSLDEASEDEAGHVRGYRRNFNQTVALRENVPNYLEPECQSVSTKQRITVKRNHRRIIKKYRAEYVPSDEDSSDYEVHTERVPRGHIMSTDYRGRVTNEPVCNHDERSYVGDRVYGYQESQQMGFTSYSPRIESMGSSQHISFAKRRESILRKYNPTSTPVGNVRYADCVYESSEVEPITYSPRINNRVLVNDDDMVEREYEPKEARNNAGNIIDSYEEQERPTHEYAGDEMYNFEEPGSTQFSHKTSCHFEGMRTSNRIATSDRSMMSSSPDRDMCMKSRRNQQIERETDECIEPGFAVEEYVQYFDEPDRPNGRYVDEGIQMFEQSRSMNISPKPSRHFGEVRKPCPSVAKGRRAISSDNVSVMEPSSYVNENIHHFENVRRSPCIKPRLTNIEPKYSSPNMNTRVALRQNQQNQPEECTEPGLAVEEYVQYFDEPDRPKGRHVDERIKMFEHSRNIRMSPKSSWHSGEIRKPCALAMEGRRAISGDNISVMEPLCSVNENIGHFEDLQRRSPRINARSVNIGRKCSSPDMNTCVALRKKQQSQPEECTETDFPVEQYVQYFDEPHRPKGRYVNEGIKMFEHSQRMNVSPKPNCHYGRVQKSCELATRNRSPISRDDDSVTEPMCSLEGNIHHFENLQKRALRCPSQSIKIRSIDATPRCSSPTRDPCVASRRKQQLQTCNETYFPAEENRYPSPCVNTRSTERHSRCFPPSRKSEEYFQRQQAITSPPRRSDETRSVCSSPNRNTCMSPREPDECIEPCYPVRENIQYFEGSQRPVRNPVDEGIRDFENMQRGKISPRWTGHFEGFQKSSRLRATDRCVDENINDFEGLQRQALGCPSRCMNPRSTELDQRCSSSCRNKCTTPREPEECTEARLPVGENIRRFEHLQRQAIGCPSPNKKRGFMEPRSRCPSPCRSEETRSCCSSPVRNVCMASRVPEECLQQPAPACPSPYRSEERRSNCSSPVRNVCMASRVPEECLQQPAPACPSPYRSEERRSNCSSPGRNVCMTSRVPEQPNRNTCMATEEPDECTEIACPVSENIQYFEGSRRPVRKHVGEGIRDFEYMQRTKINSRSFGHFEGFQKSSRLEAMDDCVDGNVQHFEDLQRQALGCPNSCVNPRSLETRQRCPPPSTNMCMAQRQPEECTGAVLPVSENIRHCEVKQRPRNSRVSDGIRDFEYVHMTNVSPVSNRCVERSHYSNSSGRRNRCVVTRDDAERDVPSRCPDETIHNFEDLQRQTSRSAHCVKSVETRSKCVTPRRDQRPVTEQRDCFEPGLSVGDNVRHFEDSQMSRCTPVGDGIRRYENVQRQQVRPASACHVKKPTCVISNDSRTVKGPSCNFNENVYDFDNTFRSSCPRTNSRRHATEPRCSYPDRDENSIPTGPEECAERGFSVDENIRNFEQSRRPNIRYVTDERRNCEDPQRRRITPVRVCQGSCWSEAEERGDIDLQRTASRTCCPSIENRSNETDSRCFYSSRGASIPRQSQSARKTKDCSVQYQPPGNKSVDGRMPNFEKPKYNCHSEGSQRSNRSYNGDSSIISRDEATMGPPSSSVNETINQFEGSQRSNWSSAKNDSIISVDSSTSIRTPSIKEDYLQDRRYDSLDGSYINRKSSVLDYEKNYPRDDIRSLVYTLMSPYYEYERWKERKDEEERQRTSHKYSVSGSQRERKKDRFVMDDEYCRIKCEHAINELLLMQKLLAESQTGVTETERLFQKILDRAICERFSTIAKKAMVTTVLDTNLEERVKCGLLVLNITYALHLNISERSLSSEAITSDTKRFIKEILNGIIGREARDILRMKGDILNGFKIQMDLGEVQLNGQECSLFED